MPARKLTQIDICDEKLFPQFLIPSLNLLMAMENTNMEECVLKQQQLDEWVICLKCNKTGDFGFYYNKYLQDGGVGCSSRNLTLGSMSSKRLHSAIPAFIPGAFSQVPLPSSCESLLYQQQVNRGGQVVWDAGRWIFEWEQEHNKEVRQNSEAISSEVRQDSQYGRHDETVASLCSAVCAYWLIAQRNNP